MRVRKEYYNVYDPQEKLYLCYCGFEPCRKNFVCKPHIRECYLIHYVVKGCCMLDLEGEKYLAHAGDIFVIPPGRLVTYNDHGTDLTYYWFAFGGEEADAVFEDGLKRQHVLTLPPKNTIIPLITGCFTELSKEFPNKYVIRGNLNLLIANITGESQPEELESEEERKNYHIDKALHFIQHNYMKDLTVGKIADYLGLERTYFSKLFKRKTGSTPIDYINNCQLDKALELIVETNYSFQKISKLVGICDQYYFTKLVKQHTGCPPSEYRRRHAKKPAKVAK